MKGANFGDSIFDFPTTFTPEKVYNRFCRIVERKVLTMSSHDDKDYGKIINITREIMHLAPVFFLDVPEIKRISEYCTDNPIDLSLFPIPVLPFNEIAISNPYSTLLIYDSEPRNESSEKYWHKIGGDVEPKWRCKFMTLLQEDDGWLWAVGIALLSHTSFNARVINIEQTAMAISDKTGDPESDEHRIEYLDTMKDIVHSNQIHDVLSQNISRALDAFNYINSPRYHLVIEEPKKFDPNIRRPKLPRAAEKPRIRLIEPESVRKIYPHQPKEDQSGRTITPHARRGHIRYLKSSRYKSAMGKQIIVRPTWVGDPIWEHGNIRYRVISR